MTTTDMIPEPMAVLPLATCLRVRSDPAFDDAALAHSRQPAHMVPLSTVRGRLGGYDDVLAHNHPPDTDDPPSFFWLQLLEPLAGWILDTEIEIQEDGSIGLGETVVHNGPVTEGSRWVYTVVCSDGALVRSGLELSSSHMYTLRRHALVEISERRINEQGLARLRTADGRGWISEQLNPLSGHRGPVVELVKMPAPLRYKVSLPEGAVVRQTCELSSPIIRLVPYDHIVDIKAKCYSNHPASHCIPRFRLADGSGWVSERLNREPPEDVPVLSLQSALEPTFDEDGLAGSGGGRGSEANGDGDRGSQGVRQAWAWGYDESRTKTQAARGAADAERAEEGTAQDVQIAQALASMQVAQGEEMGGQKIDTTCVVCLAAPRLATIVHAETGHIACCMECARVLKARGDRCPVCRMEIDLVIQHFWA